jgi:asparagine synthase (glutamine-hydrolysing)
MCGIVGTFNLQDSRPIDLDLLKRMLSVQQHRGPDEFGIYRDDDIGIGSARLSILDLKGGLQPIHNEDKTIWTVLNGEIFNYLELRAALIAQGHAFYTKTDTEVIVHLFEEYGEKFLEKLNGQFAIAVWDVRQKKLLLARDRVGIRPLFYTVADGVLIFASEIKSLLLDNRVEAKIDIEGLDQIFTFWVTQPPRTIFRNIYQLYPGEFIIADKNQVRSGKFWQLSFPPDGELPAKSEDYYVDNLRELLIDSTRLQVRADVPVGVYLSGGIDSSVIGALVKNFTDAPLKTFSVGFTDSFYDESLYQGEMVNHLESEHHAVSCAGADIGRVFPQVVWHTETPILRTAPAPLFMLSELVRENNVKVVLTGEGGDELFLGYDIYRETKIKRAWARNPKSSKRTILLQKLYPYLTLSQLQSQAYLEAFFGTGLRDVNEPHYSHIPTWTNTAKIKKYFSEDLKSTLNGYDCIQEFKAKLPTHFSRWHFQSKAQYIDTSLLLAGYLLASQGDRMAMAHSVEGRFPYLDHRVIEFAAKIPPNLKLKVMNEKYILKKCMEKYIPSSIRNRSKKAYRAPNIDSFVTENKPADYVAELLSPQRIKDAGYFNPLLVEKLVQKCLNKKSVMGEVDNMAFVGILSFQLVVNQFIKHFQAGNIPLVENIKVFQNGGSHK